MHTFLVHSLLAASHATNPWTAYWSCKRTFSIVACWLANPSSFATSLAKRSHPVSGDSSKNGLTDPSKYFESSRHNSLAQRKLVSRPSAPLHGRQYSVGLSMTGRKRISESSFRWVVFGGDNLHMLLFKYFSRFRDSGDAFCVSSLANEEINMALSQIPSHAIKLSTIPSFFNAARRSGRKKLVPFGKTGSSSRKRVLTAPVGSIKSAGRDSWIPMGEVGMHFVCFKGFSNLRAPLKNSSNTWHVTGSLKSLGREAMLGKNTSQTNFSNVTVCSTIDGTHFWKATDTNLGSWTTL